jgi:hypothetical protein
MGKCRKASKRRRRPASVYRLNDLRSVNLWLTEVTVSCLTETSVNQGGQGMSNHRKAGPKPGLTAKERAWVEATRVEIMEVVDEFVPASDATRIEQSLGLLIDLLVRKAS